MLSADGSELPAPRTMVAETLAPGQTADVLVPIPATAATSTKYALYDAALALNNSSASGIGGMLAIIDASGTAGGDVVGPATTGVTLTETAPGSGPVHGDRERQRCRDRQRRRSRRPSSADALPPGRPRCRRVRFELRLADRGRDVVCRAIDTTGWAPAPIRSLCAAGMPIGNWGPYASATIAIDRTGPTTSALTLNPNPSSGSVSVALSGTASDVATGNGNIVAAEYWLGAPGANGTGTQ